MTPTNPTTPTQVLIQIDGLSRPALQRAIDSGAAPTLDKFAGEPANRMISVYSGLPSTTPAAQAELFYGVRHAVPGFAFFDREFARVRHMLEPASADHVEQRLREGRAALLEGGSAYCDIYTAGAVAPRFCPAGLAHPPNPINRGFKYRLRSWAAYTGVGVRAVTMLAGEALRMIFSEPRDTSIPVHTRLDDAWNRIIASVVLRDNSRLAAIDDIRSGLPVVHVNFVGYDKQAHRYGPDSPPARRALQGADRAIASILRAAGERDNGATILVYSDHGQEATTPVARGETAGVEQWMTDVAGDLDLEKRDTAGGDEHRRNHRRAIGEAIAEGVGEHVLGIGASRDNPRHATFTCVESGPIAHVYLHVETTDDERAEIARRLAGRHPAVTAIATGDHAVISAFAGADRFESLHALCASRLSSHPFREQVENDLDELCRHPFAGDVVLLATGFGPEPHTFAPERGSHAGPGPDETHAFAIASADWLPEPHTNQPVRFSDLRDALLAMRSPDVERT